MIFFQIPLLILTYANVRSLLWIFRILECQVSKQLRHRKSKTYKWNAIKIISMSSVTRIVAIVEEDTGKKTYRSHQQSYNIPIILCYYCLLWLLGRCSPTLLQRFLKDFHYGPKMESVTAKANAGLPCLALAMLCCAQWNEYFLREH